MKKKRWLDSYDSIIDMEAYSYDGGILNFEGLMDVDRPKARELAAILTHFAETGELPGEVGNGPIPGV